MQSKWQILYSPTATAGNPVPRESEFAPPDQVLRDSIGEADDLRCRKALEWLVGELVQGEALLTSAQHAYEMAGIPWPGEEKRGET